MELKKAQELAIKLMDAYGLIDDGWTFRFDNSKRRFGVCSYLKKTPTINGRIGLSKYLVVLNDEKAVRNTILHEIAHALTVGHHHDAVWVAKAKEIGCDGTRCYNPDELETLKLKYVANCPKCEKVFYKQRRPKYQQSCGTCSPRRFSSEFLLQFKINN